MTGSFSFLICLVGLSIWVIVYIIRSIERSIKYAIEDRALFADDIPKSRARFLKEAFGLAEDELKQLHFDGYYFHMTHPCIKFRKVSCISVEDVTVVNSRLPHSVSWRYERVNGGPDRRYSNNPMTMTSRRFRLHFSGAADYTLTTYGRPYWDNIQETLNKINRLLGVATVINLERTYNRYEAAFDKAEQGQALLNRAKKRKIELESTLVASARLSAQYVSLPNLPSKQSEMRAELKQLDSEISRLQLEIASATSEMEALVQFARTEAGKFEDVQLVQSYRPA